MNLKRFSLSILLFFPVSIFLLASCQKEIDTGLSISNDQAVNIDVDPSSRILQIDEIVDSLELIPLETSDQCMIGHIDKIIYKNSKYYLLDRRQSKSIFRFDSTGRFEGKIGDVGRGPGEYIEPTDFIVNRSGIIVLDQYTRKLLFYTTDGKFKNKTDLPCIAYEITRIKSDSLLLAICGDNQDKKDIDDYEFVIMDTTGKIISKGIHNRYGMNYSSSYSCQQSANGILYHKSLRSTIYQIDPDGITECYHLNILESPLPADYEKECHGDYENFMTDYKGKYNYFSGDFWENDDFVFFTVINKQQIPVSVLYDKTNRKTKCGIMGMQSGREESGIYGALAISMNNCIAVNGSEIIGNIHPMYIPDFTNLSRWAVFPKPIDENANPVLFKLKLKFPAQNE